MPDAIRMSLIEADDGFAALLETAIGQTGSAIVLQRDRHWREFLGWIATKEKIPGALAPHIILMNIDESQPDWREGLDAIKSTPWLKRLPLLAYASVYDDKSAIEAYQRHANCYMLRPTNPDNALPWLEKLISFWINTVISPLETVSNG